MQNVATQLHRSCDIDLTQLLMLHDAGVRSARWDRTANLFVCQPQSGKAFSANQWTSSRGQNAIAGIEYQGRASDPTSGYASWNGILAVLQSTTDVAVKA